MKVGKSRAKCHPEHDLYSHGLCRSCAIKEDRKNNPEKYKAKNRREYLRRKRKYKKWKPACHPERKYLRNGLCAGCYVKRYRLKYPKKAVQDSRRTNARALSKGYWKDFYMKNKPKTLAERRFKMLWTKYRLTKERFYELLQSQKYKCPLCFSPISEDKFNVDHDHNKHKSAVRGLLCFSCNALLGKVEKDPQKILRMFQYLKNHSPEAVDGIQNMPHGTRFRPPKLR